MKPDNALINWQPSLIRGEPHLFDIRLIDIGFSERIPDSDSTTVIPTRNRLKGTFVYLAPELNQDAGWQTKSDIWACVVMLFELFTGELPF